MFFKTASTGSALLAIACLLTACGDDDENPSGAAGSGGKSASSAGTSSTGTAAGSGSTSNAGKTGSSNAGNTGSTSNAGNTGSAGMATAGAGTAGANEPGQGTAGKGGDGVCNLACVKGKHCELMAVQCIRAPCPAQPSCVDDAGSPANAMVDCDPSKVTCDQGTPKCAGGTVPSVKNGCYAGCVAPETCACNKPSACPLPDEYTCHMSAGHCGPFVN